MNIRRRRAYLHANLCASDNGSAFVDAALTRAAARLGIKITHSTPGRPQGRGKIERFFGVVRQEFLVEIGDGSSVADLAQLNKLFTAWYETVFTDRTSECPCRSPEPVSWAS